MRLTRRWRRLLLSLAAVLAVALVLLYSETVLRLGVYLLTDVLVKPLTVAEVQGRLAGPFTLRGIAYEDAGNRLSLDELSVDWHPSQLLVLTANLSTLHAKGLRYSQLPVKTEAPPAPSPTPFTLPQIGFPLNLIVGDAAVEGISLSLAGQEQPLAISRVALQAETELNTLRLHTLALQSEWLDFALSGTLRPRKDYRVDLKMTWRLPQPQGEPWRGRGVLRGNLREVNLQQRLIAPFGAELVLTARDLLDKLAWQGRLTVPQVKSSQLPYPISPAFSLGGELKAEGGLEAFSGKASVSGKVDTVGEIEGELEAALAGQRLKLSRLLLKRQNDAARIEASGELGLVTPRDYRLQAKWQSLSWPQTAPSIRSERGSVGLEGEETQYRFNGEFALGGTQIPDGQWRLLGSGDEKALTLSTLEGKLLDGRIDGEATVALAPHLGWHGKLSGSGLNPAVKWPQWPGRVAFASEAHGKSAKEGLQLEFALSDLSGELRGRPLQGHSEATVQGNVVTLRQLALRLGKASLSGRGSMSDTLAFEGQLIAPDLADLLPQASGTLSVKAELSGPVATPRLNLRLEGEKPALLDISADTVQAEAALDMRQGEASRVRLQVEQLQLPGFVPQTLRLEADGPLKDHRLSLDIHSLQQRLSLGIAAGYADGRWAGKIDRLQLDDGKLGQWQLAQAAAFSLGAERMQLDELCLGHAAARLCSQGEWELDKGYNAVLRSAAFPLQLLGPYLPKRFAVEGELDGKAMLAMAPEAPPRLDVDLRVGKGRVQVIDPDTGAEEVAQAIAGAGIRLTSSAAGDVDGELSLSLDAQDRIVFTLQTSLAHGLPAEPLSHPLRARLRAGLGDLGFASPLIPEVQNLHGALDVDISLSGSIAAPQLSGYAKLDGGSMEIARMGLKLSAIQLAATGDNTRRLDISGTARSGEGALNLTGQLAPNTEGAWVLELATKGKDFEVARIPEARMRISPDLKLQVVGREIHLEGDLDIPYARLEPRDISLAVKPSDDVVIVGKKEPEKAELWKIYTRLRVTAPDSIRFIGYGFDGRVGGDLLLVDEPGSVTRGRGELHVVPGGSYKAFGQKLTTDRGRLTFADSPVDNPNLDIKASRTIGDVIAGINVSGTAKKPVLALYSEPPMDQADILSYLTLGHAMNTAGKGEGEALASAADTAGLVGGNYLTGYIGRQFGLEEARVETSADSQSPWVIVGKYLTPRLYVRYGAGVYEGAYSIIMRYQLTEHWQVQGEGGQNSGADILYTFERD